MRGGCVRVRRIIEPIDRLPVGSGNEVPVNIDGDLNRVVPHLFTYVLRGLALLQEQRREGVAIIPTSELST